MQRKQQPRVRRYTIRSPVTRYARRVMRALFAIALFATVCLGCIKQAQQAIAPDPGRSRRVFVSRDRRELRPPVQRSALRE